MKNIGLLTWLTQLGLSVVVPLVGFILLGVYLHNRFTLGSWVIIVGVVLGVVFSADGLRQSLKVMGKLAKDKSDADTPVCFNDHD